MGRDTAVSPRVVLEGAWYAFEQAGFLLGSAVTLFDAGQYATAVGLALLAHEELGKHRILVDPWWETQTKGAQFSVGKIQKGYESHPEKQRRGQLSVIFHGLLPDWIRKALMGGAEAPTYEDARRELDQILRRLARRTPNERHRTRMDAHYVDIEASGNAWNRPVDISRERALDIVQQASSDYSVRHHNMGIWLASQDSLLHPEAGALRAWVEAVKKWSQRPELPAPRFPDH
jgi:AbiV family abortive infection protein